MSSPTRATLEADCARCRALCCVGPAFAASADFAIDKPAAQPCPHLAADDRCGIHDRLRERGFPGCVAYDCFGAGQHVVEVTFGGADRTPSMLAVLPVVRALHELRWYLEEVLTLPVAAPVHADAARLRDALVRLGRGRPDDLLVLDVDERRAEVGPVLRRASALVRRPAGPDLHRRDLVGAALRGARLRGADLRGALLLGADLRGADLRTADLLGADLRGADLRGADLGGALFVTPGQVRSAVGDVASLLPEGWGRPAHWR